MDPKEQDEPRFNRRHFFQALAGWGIQQAQNLGQTTTQALQIDSHTAPGMSPPPRYLRPPGALSEPEFADACTRCGDCVKACPAQCIKLDSVDTANEDQPQQPLIAGGLPYIVSRESPCVVCDELSCMNACPSGALLLTDRTQFNMGTAVMDYNRCLRHAATEPTDSDCRQCIADCPIGDTAISLTDDGHIDVRNGCTGCGVCERVCPTEPPSITVITDRTIMPHQPSTPA